MIYETIFHRICKHMDYDDGDDFKIFLLDESGTISSYIILYQCLIDGIDGLEFDFSKVERQMDSFQVTFKFNNINFEFMPDDQVFG